MTAGQKAMAYAFIYEKPQQGMRTDLSPTSSNLEQVTRSRLSEARAILKWSRTKASDILNGALPFDQVLKEMNGEAEKSLGNTAKIMKLRRLRARPTLPGREPGQPPPAWPPPWPQSEPYNRPVCTRGCKTRLRSDG